ncbi:phage replisome organizer N-terminal domain-containing protein [Enterococcus casseliflavus]|uniref:phage replisome organizer N-terminal domain-containing protein n=1 Tax=Enterococcus casseliflavus TaxID=37734 RepID=UPI002DBC9374|nr:phage replisome organizer N-terminal domain-containing protein [Enterococcus casseliflavus]MEB8400954.1 phage replisome organizer N-terminal domain-containing protein [Enterococcus casseliflavus]
MAEISWIKLKTTMFDDEKIRLIQAVPESDAILVIWIRLLVLAGKTNDDGLIYIQRNMPYSEEMLATLFGKNVNTVRLALTTLASFNMIDLSNDGLIAISNWEKHQNVEGMEKVREQNRLRAKKHYEKKKNSNVSLTLDITQPNATDIDKELDIEIDKERDIEKKKKKKSHVRHKYGEYQNVLLSDQQLEQLKEEFPKDWEQRIDRVSSYCESTGKTYKNYLATIRNWARKDKEPAKGKLENTGSSEYDDLGW